LLIVTLPELLPLAANTELKYVPSSLTFASSSTAVVHEMKSALITAWVISASRGSTSG